jgi:hypothetical protein
MENILALGGRRTSPPQNDARQPRLVRLDQWVVFWGSVISLFGLLQPAQAATSVTLAWDPSGTSGIAGYRLHYGTSSHSYSQTSDLGNTTTTTLSNLLPGQTYYFAITDYNTTGVESLPSNEVQFTTTVPIGNGPVTNDLVWENSVTGERGIWILTDGVLTGIVGLPAEPTSWHIVGVGDFLGNKQTGLVWENSQTGEHGIWVLQNGVLSQFIQLPTEPTSWHVVGAADFDGDGQADLVWENSVTGERGIWLLKGGVLSRIVSLPTEPTNWHIAGAADFDGDGKADLVWENTVTGERGIWFLKAGVLSRIISLPTEPTSWHIAGAADFNGDGQADLVWENTVTGERGIWFLKAGVVTWIISLPTEPTSWHIVNH